MPVGEINREPVWPELNPDLRKQSGTKRYINNTTLINVPFRTGAASVSFQILQANRSRNYLLVQNKSASNMWLVFNNSATVFAGVLIEAGGFYEPYKVPWSSVNVFSTVANLDGVAVEGVES